MLAFEKEKIVKNKDQPCDSCGCYCCGGDCNSCGCGDCGH